MTLFGEELPVVPDDAVEAVLRAAMRSPYAGRLPRHAELLLAEVCARHLVEHLALAGMKVVWLPGRAC